MKKHPFNKSKLGFKIFVWKNRFYSIRKDILIPFFISFISILLIELWLINIPAPFAIFYNLGSMYLKLCYSFFSAFIFYFLVVHIPKERRKLKVFRQINNKISIINLHVFNLIDSLFGGNNDQNEIYKIKPEDISEACKKINPNIPVFATNYDSTLLGKIAYSNWFDFSSETVISIKTAIRDILLLGESVDTKLLESLTHLDDTTRYLALKSKIKIHNLELLNFHLNQLKNDSIELFKTFNTTYGKFAIEYHTNARKKKSRTYSTKHTIALKCR